MAEERFQPTLFIELTLAEAIFVQGALRRAEVACEMAVSTGNKLDVLLEAANVYKLAMARIDAAINSYVTRGPNDPRPANEGNGAPVKRTQRPEVLPDAFAARLKRGH